MTREEAIEVYNGLINTKIKEAFEFFAPELANEDERIRKIITLALIASEDELSAFYSTHNITRKKCTDWLEKQKESVDYANKEYWRGYREGKQVILDKYAELEKQKEQKPIFKEGDKVIWQDEEFNILDVNEDSYNVGGYILPFYRQNELSLVGQKPAKWTYPYNKNETVDKLIAIAECLEADGDCSFNGYTGTECGKFLRELARKQVECKWSEEDKKIAETICKEGDLKPSEKRWLKSLPERFSLQSRQEWSEEDKKRIQRIYDFLWKNRKGDTDTIYQIEKDANWLIGLSYEKR